MPREDSPVAMSASKRAASPGAFSTKRPRASSPAQPPSLHSWLHPNTAPPLMTHSPPLHSSTSTFLSFSISFIPPSHVTTETSLLKEVRRMVRELNVVAEVGDLIMKDNDGAFQDGEGRITNGKGKERAREPDHRMWGVRALVLKEGRDGTKGEDDYQLLECFNDDGEKFGGDRVLKVLKEERGVDVLTVCCRWYGGDMLGPIRFQHIGLTVKTSLQALVKLTTLKELRDALEGLDSEIEALRQSLNPDATPTKRDSQNNGARGKFDDVEDVVKLERLLMAREKTKTALEGKVGWATIEKARTEAHAG